MAIRAINNPSGLRSRRGSSLNEVAQAIFAAGYNSDGAWLLAVYFIESGSSKIWRASPDNPAGSPWILSGMMKSLMELPPIVTAPPSPAPTTAITTAITAVETSVEVATALEALMAVQLVALPPLVLT